MDTDTKKKATFGTIGCIVGFLALAAAFLSPQIAEAIDPPAKPIEENIADFAVKLKDAAVAKMKGEAYQPPPAEKKPSAALFPAIIALGMIGAGLGLTSLLKGEKKAISGTAMTLGICAAIVQWSILFAGVIVFCLILVGVCSALDIDLPSP
jgi:hypothetical protein